MGMEVLSPAGSWPALAAAVLGGADAVYLSGRGHGARRLANNFAREELPAAVRYAHDRGCKVYVAVNTLVKEEELEESLRHVEELQAMGADAVIVQDRGLLREIVANLGIRVHASTQLGLHTADGLRWAEAEGIDRVILAREMGLDEIAAVSRDVEMEIEVFVHGALCYCFSGQCLFSSVLGGRSGNRGMCAQPCRKHYRLGPEDEYLLSTADIFGVDSIRELLRLGVAAVKIEGRMRSPEYVYAATLAYKNAVGRAIRGEAALITDRERDMLETAFNRGFSPGYLTGRAVMQRRFPESRGKPLGTAISDGRELAMRDGQVSEGDGLTLYSDGAKVGGFHARDARTMDGLAYFRPPFRVDVGAYEAYKTKDHELAKLDARLAAESLPSVAVPRASLRLDMSRVLRPEVEPELSFYVNSLGVLRAVAPFADRVYFECARNLDEASEACEAEGIPLVSLLPRVDVGSDVDERAVMVSNPGQAHRYRERDIYLSHHMNSFNSRSLMAKQTTLSPELSRADIAAVLSHTRERVEVMAFGRIELMVTRDPTLAEGSLVDDTGTRFSVHRDQYGWAHILNSADLLLLDHVGELGGMGVDSLGLDVRGRHTDVAKLVGMAFSKGGAAAKAELKKACGAVTSFHYHNGVS
jgi:putative protease